MKLSQLIPSYDFDPIVESVPDECTLDVSTIAEKCSDFLKESRGRPLYRNLPCTYADVHRVKARHTKHHSSVASLLDEAFTASAPKLSARGVRAYAISTSPQENMDAFYVFPVDGFKYTYNPNVKNYDAEIAASVAVISKYTTEAQAIAAELIKMAYTQTDLAEGIASGAEIIVYNSPCFYAVRTSAVPSYSSLLKKLTTPS